MKHLLPFFAGLWILCSSAVLVLVFLPELRVFLPSEFVKALAQVPYLSPVLSWPQDMVWPGVFGGLVVVSDGLVLFLIFRRKPKLSQVLEQKASPAKAKVLTQLGDFRRAAEVYGEIGAAAKGAKLLVEHGYTIEAARLLLEYKKEKKAEALLRDIDNRDAETAASMLASAGREAAAKELFRRAAAYHAEQMDSGRAGRCYFRAGDLESAKPYLENSWEEIFRPEAPLEVAKMLLEVGSYHDAGLAYSRAVACSNDVKQQQQYARKAASLLAKSGDPATGAELLEQCGQIDDAAELYAHSGDIEKSVQLLRSTKSFSRAAEILIKTGDKAQAVECLVDAGEIAKAAQVAVKAGMVRQAASLLERVGSIDVAIKLLEDNNELEEAAELVRVSGNLLHAASLYERAGAFVQAAAIYKDNGDDLRAASLYFKGGNGVEASQLYFKNGRIKEASEALGGLVNEATRALHAQLGARFVESGDSGQALEHLMAAITGTSITPENVGVYYHLAVLYQQMEDMQTALTLYQQVYSINPYLEGLAPRIQQVQAQLLQQQQTANATPSAQANQPPADPRYAETVGAAAVASESGMAPPSNAKERYRVEGELGRGAMGRVLRVFDQVLQRGVALKVLPETLASQPAARNAFLAEARAAAALQHPHIVTIYDVGTQDGVPYLAMELVEGCDLGRHMQKEPGLKLSQRLQLLAEVAEALQAAHSSGIVHRDVKPGNVLVDGAGHVRLVDFGIARAVGSLDSKGAAIGTPFYMSPEQAQGLSVDLHTDLYSLGVVAFEICSGRLPFDTGDVLKHHISTAPPRLRSINPELPQELDDLVFHCMAKQTAQRPQSASQVATCFRAIRC